MKYYICIKSECFTKIILEIFLFFILFSRYFQITNDNLQTNLIEVGEKDFIYLSFASYSNGDIILAMTAFPKTIKRLFYGLK